MRAGGGISRHSHPSFPSCVALLLKGVLLFHHHFFFLTLAVPGIAEGKNPEPS